MALSNTMLASETVQGQYGDYRGLTWWGFRQVLKATAGPNTIRPRYLCSKATYCEE